MRYTREAILLLAETDPSYDALSESATMAWLLQPFPAFEDACNEHLTGTLNVHLYNLRCCWACGWVLGSCDATRLSQVPTGERRPSRPEGRQSWILVDSMHQGDFDSIKGIYRIDAADEDTQLQFKGAGGASFRVLPAAGLRASAGGLPL